MGIFFTIVGLIILILVFKISFLSIIGLFYVLLTLCFTLSTIYYIKEKEIARAVCFGIPSILFLFILFKLIF